MDAAPEIGRNPVSKDCSLSLSVENERAGRGTGRPSPTRETKFSGANGDREIFIFPAQLTTSRIDYLNLPG